MARRGWAVVVVGALIACGGPKVQEDAGGGDAGIDGGIDAASDAGVDAPTDASIDAPPACGDGHLDPGELCDGVAGLAGDGCTATCAPDTITWTNLTPNPAPPRFYHQVAYDTARRRLVMFGGYDGTTESNETWEFDGTSWTRRLVLVAPPGRRAHAMVYDSVRQRVVMFGGLGVNGALGDTWEWDGVTWLERTSPTAPVAQSFHLMAYDPQRQRTVLWGDEIDTVWEWDGTSWSSKAATIPQCCGGGLRALTYDGTGVMLVGTTAVWLWNGTSWTRQAFATQVPWGDQAFSVVYDSRLGRPIAIGWGTAGDALSIWEWSNGDWTERLPVGSNAPYPSYVAAAYDPDRELVVVYGTATGPFGTAQIWEWNGTSWRLRYDSIPPPCSLSTFAYDARRGRVVMFCGGNADTWEWDGVTWHARSSPTTPSARWDSAVTYDERRGRVVLHGGFHVTGGQYLQLDDTWEWDGTNWRQAITSTHPRTVSSIAFDRAHGYVMAVGGGETWTWDGVTWTKLAPAHAASGRLVYDARRGVVVLITGTWDSMYNPVATVWEWDGTEWVGKGSALTGHEVFYDPLRARIVVHDSRYPLERFWTWDGSTWSEAIASHSLIEPHAIFAPNTGAWFSFGTSSGWDTWLARASEPRDGCDGTDTDADNLVRCADPDCWWRCTPLCAPSEKHCDPFAPRCGDGTCSPIEGNALCPADCPF